MRMNRGRKLSRPFLLKVLVAKIRSKASEGQTKTSQRRTRRT